MEKLKPSMIIDLNGCYFTEKRHWLFWKKTVSVPVNMEIAVFEATTDHSRYVTFNKLCGLAGMMGKVR